MFGWFRELFHDSIPVSHRDDVERGVRAVEGIVRIEEPLRSPIRGHACVAFFYNPLIVIPSRQAPTIHKLKTHEVYAPFELQMEGGVLPVVPSGRDDFDQGQHLEQAKRYGDGYHAEEDLVLPGARVRALGVVKSGPDGLYFRMKSVEILEKQAVTTGVTGDRKKRRQKRKGKA